MSEIEVTIATEAGPRTVPATISPSGQLCVHRGVAADRDRWVMTHTASGTAIASFPGAFAAVKCCENVDGLDWDHGALGELKSASFPHIRRLGGKREGIE